MTKPSNFGDVEATLREFGYEQGDWTDHWSFRHPEGHQVLVLPKLHSKAAISMMHRTMVESTIRVDEVVTLDDFQFFLEHGKRREDFINKGDRLIWRVPGGDREIDVVAASGEEDGLVIIKQKDTFSPCPAIQLRKKARVKSKRPASSGRG